MIYKVAVIGSGISGLGASWAVAKHHHITLFEKSSRLGGHANTVMVDIDNGLPVDTGFIVYNQKNYPFLTDLFQYLSVATEKSNMSFSVSLDNRDFEYSSNLLSLVFDKKTWLDSRFRNLLAGLAKFYTSPLKSAQYDKTTNLYDYLKLRKFSDQFISDHIVPMCSAIWSCNSNSVIHSSAESFVSFFSNHQLAKLFGRPKWRTVTGGSRQYILKILKDSKNLSVKTSMDIETIDRSKNEVTLFFKNGEKEVFDKLIFATHLDDALSLLKNPTEKEREILAGIKYSRNVAVLHEDDKEMPMGKNLWSAWNFIGNYRNSFENVRVSYWMNRLQNLSTGRQLFVTLNPQSDLKKVHYQTQYTHPIFDSNADEIKSKSIEIQGKLNTWFCSACLGDGFHEDGLQAGLWVAKQITGRLPFSRERIFNRLPMSYQKSCQ